jgi:hypothetical protein
MTSGESFLLGKFDCEDVHDFVAACRCADFHFPAFNRVANLVVGAGGESVLELAEMDRFLIGILHGETFVWQ